MDLPAFLAAETLPASYAEVAQRLHRPLADRIAGAARAKGAALVVGLTGPQGSGKTTSAMLLQRLLDDHGLRVAVLSLDDLYLPLADRRRLAAEVHPLCVTRGVPGTHEAPLGLSVIDSLRRAGQTLMPRFDKASDDRLAREAWTAIEGPVEVILFEGWCVGARPQAPEALVVPVNALERDEDPRAAWRTWANNALAGAYQALFAPIDLQVFFAPPAFEAVLGWRLEQEHKLRARLDADQTPGPRGQTDAELARFIQHYERLTRFMADEMPLRADAVVRLGWKRELRTVEGL